MSREPHDGEYAAGRSQVPDLLMQPTEHPLGVFPRDEFIPFLKACDFAMPKWIYHFGMTHQASGEVVATGFGPTTASELRGAARMYLALLPRLQPISLVCEGEIR